MVAVISTNFGLIGFIVLVIVHFLDFRFWLETAYLRPLLESFWSISPKWHHLSP